MLVSDHVHLEGIIIKVRSRIRASTGVFSVIVLLASLFLYTPPLNFGFLSDDYLDLEHGFDLGTFTRFEAGGFRPLTVAVWAFDSAVHGPTGARGWHVTNILLHMLCAVSLVLLLRALGLGVRGILAAAAVFLLSPAVIPSAARVSGRTTIIALLPLLLSFWLHVRWELSERGKWHLLVLAQALYLVSLLAKETALLAPLSFAALSLWLAESNRRGTHRAAAALLLYLIPVAIYIAWRVAAVGLALGYRESAELGPYMLRNLLLLARMPLSPWLDGLPARTLLLLALATAAALHRHWRSVLLVALLLFGLLVTVSNLPPRSYYAYAALPGVAVMAGLAAGRFRGWRATALLLVLLAGLFLQARDELGRMSVASDYTQRTLDRLAEVVEDHPRMLVAVSGLKEDVAGYGTVWPGAYREALLTRGISGIRTPPFTSQRLWEHAHPGIANTDTMPVLSVDLGYSPALLDTVRVADRAWRPAESPDTTVRISESGTLSVGDALWRYNSCSVHADGGDDAALLLVSQEGRIETIGPHRTLRDTAYYDLESSLLYLAADRPFALLFPGRGSEGVRFSLERLYLPGLRRDLSRKAAITEAHGLR